MNTEEIHHAFAQLIGERGSGKKMGISATYKGQLAHKLRRGSFIRLDTKVRLLKKAQAMPPEKEFTIEQVMSIINFTATTSRMAREFGAAYVLEKWRLSRK